jgi:hypothetical protein
MRIMEGDAPDGPRVVYQAADGSLVDSAEVYAMVREDYASGRTRCLSLCAPDPADGTTLRCELPREHAGAHLGGTAEMQFSWHRDGDLPAPRVLDEMVPTGWRAQDVPRLKAEQRDCLGSDLTQMGLVSGIEAGNWLAPAMSTAETLLYLTMTLPIPFVKGDSYWIDTEMQQLGMLAADKIGPSWHFTADDLPSPHGFLAFESGLPYRLWSDISPMLPEACNQHVAVAWRTLEPHEKGVDGRPGVILYWFTRGRTMLLDPQLTDEQRRRLSSELGPLQWDIEAFLTFDHVNELREQIAPQVAWLYAVWRMMSVPRPAQVAAHPVNSRERKTATRLGVSPEVTVISVRPQDRAALAALTGGKADDGLPSRIYRYRWWVAPYKRMQWYPRLGIHKPMLIWLHIKGPEGAPFLDPKTKKPVVRVLK